MADFLKVGGAVLSAGGTLSQGRSAERASRFEAAQLEQRGRMEFAQSSRQASEERRQSRLVQSRALAVGAASGGGVPFEQVAALAGEGEYRALTALFEGEEAMKGRTMQATAARFEGKSALRASRIGATASLLSAGGSLYEKYGG